MSNMSYCRFENTLRDMQDCLQAIYDEGSVQNYVNQNDPSQYELGAIRRMVGVSKELAEVLEFAEKIEYEGEE